MISRRGRGSLILFCMLPAVAAAGAQGGKAEPQRVQFRRGASGSTVRGVVRGDEEHEFAVAARKGQWMFLEVSASPRDSAVLTVLPPNAETGPPQYAWSGRLPATRDYVLRVSKPAEYPTSSFSLTVSVRPHPPVPETVATNPGAASLHAAMRKFTRAVRAKDRAAFLACFSRSTPFSHLNPMNIGSRQHYRTVVRYSDLARDLQRKKGRYWTYLERGDGGDADAFVDHVEDGRAWGRVWGERFVPPGSEITSPVYVRWRKEGSGWVVDEISYPQA